jgi:hypothetical protein
MEESETTHVRIYESDKKKVEELVEDGTMPAKLRQVVNDAVAWNDRGSDVL